MTALIDLSLVQRASGANQTAIPALQCALQIARQNYPEDSLPVGYTSTFCSAKRIGRPEIPAMPTN